MARIKYVMNERRLAYERGLEHLVGEESWAAWAQAEGEQQAAQEYEEEEVAVTRKKEVAKKKVSKVAGMAMAGLFENAPRSSKQRQ